MSYTQKTEQQTVEENLNRAAQEAEVAMKHFTVLDRRLIRSKALDRAKAARDNALANWRVAFEAYSVWFQKFAEAQHIADKLNPKNKV